MSTESAQIRQWRALTERPAVRDPRSRPLGWWAMAFLVVSEAVLFSILLVSYFYVRWRTTHSTPGGWPPDGLEEEKLLLPTLELAALLISGATMWLATRAIRAGRSGALSAGLLATLVAAGGFLTVQTLDYVDRVTLYTPQTNAYGSFVYTITGAHVAHVIAGMLLLGWVLVRTWTGAYSAERHLGVRVAAMYWGFLVVLEVVVYVCLFVTPYL